MKKELNKEDLISMVLGTAPYYSVYDHPLVKRTGVHIGGFVDEWSWNRHSLAELTEEELYELYTVCKES